MEEVTLKNPEVLNAPEGSPESQVTQDNDYSALQNQLKQVKDSYANLSTCYNRLLKLYFRLLDECIQGV